MRRISESRAVERGLITSVAERLADHAVEAAVAIGSRVWGTPIASSDLDVVVVANQAELVAVEHDFVRISAETGVTVSIYGETPDRTRLAIERGDIFWRLVFGCGVHLAGDPVTLMGQELADRLCEPLDPASARAIAARRYIPLDPGGLAVEALRSVRPQQLQSRLATIARGAVNAIACLETMTKTRDPLEETLPAAYRRVGRGYPAAVVRVVSVLSGPRAHCEAAASWSDLAAAASDLIPFARDIEGYVLDAELLQSGRARS